MVISVLYDVSTDRVVRLADVDACGGVGCLLHTLATGSLRPQATMLALDLLKKLTRTFSLDMVDRVLALDGPRVVAGVLADGMERGCHLFSSGLAEIVSRSLLLLCRWAALSPSRLQGAFDDFWKVLLRASRSLDSFDASDSLDPRDEQQRHLAYAFCGVCVLSTDDASKLAGLCVDLEENMRAVCTGLDAYRGRFPCDRLPRAVVTAMMTLRGDALVGRAFQVKGMSFLRAGGGMAGAAILRGARLPDETGCSGLADFVATSVGAAGVFHADADSDARKRIVCELLEEELCGDGGGDHTVVGGDFTVTEGSQSPPETDEPNLQKETSMDSIVLDTLCRDSASKSRPPVHHHEQQRPGGKRGLQLISEAYTAALSNRDTHGKTQENRPSKRARRVRDVDIDCDVADARRPGPLTIRIGGSTAITVGDRRRLAELVGIVSLFEDDGSETLDLPDVLLGTVPDEDRFVRACAEVLRFLSRGDRATAASEDWRWWENDDHRTYDCWIVADYLGVSCDRLHAALYRASTAETIERLLLRFPHLAPTISRCAWQRYGECEVPGGLFGRGSPVARLLIEGVYDHLCETLLMSDRVKTGGAGLTVTAV